MKPIKKDNISYFFESADKVENAFYRAFGEGDINLMKQLFADENVCFAHPNSPILIGRQNVINYWQLILEDIESATIHTEIINKICRKDFEIHLVSESFSVDDRFGQISETITTNFYIKQKDGWRLQMQQAFASKETIDPDRIKSFKDNFYTHLESHSIN